MHTHTHTKNIYTTSERPKITTEPTGGPAAAAGSRSECIFHIYAALALSSSVRERRLPEMHFNFMFTNVQTISPPSPSSSFIIKTKWQTLCVQMPTAPSTPPTRRRRRRRRRSRPHALQQYNIILIMQARVKSVGATKRQSNICALVVQ